MATHRAGTIFLALIAGTIAFGLSGCKFPHHSVESFSSTEPDEHDDSRAVNIHQMGGGIDVKDAPHGAKLTTMGGDIHLGNVASFARLKTMGGNVAVDEATGFVDATTMGGSITIGQADGPIKATSMGGDITARVVGSSPERRDVELTSHSGTVTLIVPKDFPMDVQITLAYTQAAGRSYEIIDHVGLEQRETPDWETSFGSPRKIIRAAGRVGSGLNHVVIKTVNGDVILKQE
jgi:DUF4097 and DUF4098 domain-containing protein YvlB